MARILVENDGTINHLPAGVTTPVELSLPVNISAVTGKRPSGVVYRKKLYMAGPWNHPVVVTEDYKVWAMGIQAPQTPPTLAATTSPTSVTVSGDITGYLTYVEKKPNGVWVAESNPSDASNTLTGVTGPILWSGIPTFCPNPRVTHVRGYRQDGSGIARMAWEVPLGTTSVTDLVSTAKLAAREALPVDDDGDLTLERGVPPYAKYLDTYHDRMFFAGDPKYPNRVYYSKLFEPEAVGASSFITTKDGESVTGIKRVGDQLLVFCLRGTYELQGFSGDDFKLRKLSPSIGCISHYSIVNINERLWFASEKGVYIYDGGFRYAMEYIRSDWRTRYVADPTTFADCSAMDDQEYHMYKLLIPYSSAAFYYIGNYEYFDPAVGTSLTSQPRWTHWVRGRYDTAMGRLIIAGTNRLKAYSGSSDGYVREENLFTNANDDSDSQGKAVEVRTKHFFFDNPGGNNEEGKTLVRAWSYVVSEDSTWKFIPLGGDETANSSAAEPWDDNVAASLSSGKHAKTRHVHPVPEKISGHGFTFKWTATGPLNWTWRGIGGIYGPGPSYRGNTS